MRKLFSYKFFSNCWNHFTSCGVRKNECMLLKFIMSYKTRESQLMKQRNAEKAMVFFISLPFDVKLSLHTKYWKYWIRSILFFLEFMCNLFHTNPVWIKIGTNLCGSHTKLCEIRTDSVWWSHTICPHAIDYGTLPELVLFSCSCFKSV
jgi:hypothetical protein